MKMPLLHLPVAAAALVCGTLAGLAAEPQLPELRQGMDLLAARAMLRDAGWQGVERQAPPENAGMIGYVFYELGATEVVDCAGTGMAPCRFSYRNTDGQHLAVFTIGEEPVLDSWQFGLQ